MTKAVSYPHPVVGHLDDAAGALACSPPAVEITTAMTAIALDGIKCTNEELVRLLGQKHAVCVLRVDCGSTFYRAAWRVSGTSIVVEIPSGELHGRVRLSLSVCAVAGVSGYQPSGLHTDYNGLKCDVESGAVLALGPEFNFEAADAFDELEGSVSSIFRVRPTSAADQPLAVHYDLEQITIDLSLADQAAYQALAQQLPGVVHAGVVFPALIEAIRLVMDDGEDSEHAGRKWFTRLQAMLAKESIADGTSPFTAAVVLLGHPFRRASVAVRARLDAESE